MRPSVQGARHFMPVSSNGDRDAEVDIANLPREQGVKRFLDTTYNEMAGSGRQRLDAPMEAGRATHGAPESGTSAFLRWQEETRGQALPPGERNRVESGEAGVFSEKFTDIPRTDIHVPMISRLSASVPVMRDASVQPGLTHGDFTITHDWKLDQRKYGGMYTNIAQMNSYLPEGFPIMIESHETSDAVGLSVHALSIPELAYREYSMRAAWPNKRNTDKGEMEPTIRLPGQVYAEWIFGGLPLLMQPQADAMILQSMTLECVIGGLVKMKDVFCNGPKQRAKNGYHLWMILVVRTDGHEQEERMAQLHGVLGKGGHCGYNCNVEAHEHKRYTRPEFYCSASPEIPAYVYKTSEWKGRKVYLGQVVEFSAVDVDENEADTDEAHARMISTTNLALYRKSDLDSELRQQRDAIQVLEPMKIAVAVHN